MTWTDKLDEMKSNLRELNKAAPEVTKAFHGLDTAAKASGALDGKTLELIALAIAVADRCEPCIEFHVTALIRAGGTREELAAMLAVCVQMGGGPSLMYSAKTLACFDEFSAKE
ncbi:MAG: carboxymuconolactone decarboxylase family protein [Mangrovicoccus sp.]